jgi:hypothetical protein
MASLYDIPFLVICIVHLFRQDLWSLFCSSVVEAICIYKWRNLQRYEYRGVWEISSVICVTMGNVYINSLRMKSAFSILPPHPQGESS